MTNNSHSNPSTQSSRPPSRAANWSTRFGLSGVLLMLLAVFTHRLGLMEFSLAMFGFVGGAVFGLLALVTGLIGLVVTRKTKTTGRIKAYAGLLLGLIAVSPVLTTLYAASKVPPIHDISTDLQHPPEFVALLAVRTDNHNPLDRQNPPDLDALQQSAYPGLKSALIQKNPEQVFNEALALVTARGWEIAAASAPDGRIEATATTPIMRYQDDVVIRIREQAGNTLVDMRSVSRVGKSDLGANATRIAAFLDDLSP